MFDSITAPRRSTRHRGSALALAVLLNFSGVGSMLTMGNVQSIIEDIEDVPLIEIVLAPAPAAPPAAAFSPPSAPKESIKPPKERVVEEPPVEVSEPTEPTEPTDQSPPEYTGDALAPVGPEGPASLGGCPPGEACDGPPEAIGTGCPPGEVCDGEKVMFLTSSEVRPKRRVRPDYPAAAKALNITEARCHVQFAIDAKGRPTDVQVRNCPAVFHEEVLKAAWEWRFYPVRNDSGVRSAAAFTLALTFRMN